VPSPRRVDPADLGPRQVAGYWCLWEAPREHYDPDTRVKFRETIDPAAFDDEVRLLGSGHPFALLWDHGMANGDPGVPIGHSVHVDPADPYGGFCVVELGRGQLADKALAAARAGEIGFSYHGTDMDPETDERDGMLHIRRRRMQLREISLTPRPAEPRSAVLAVGGPQAPGLDLDLRDMTDEDLITRASAMLEATGGNRAVLEMQVARDRAARRRRTEEQATRVRELAHCVYQGHRRAATLRSAAADEAGKWPQHPTRPAAAILAEAIVEKAAAVAAEAELREELCNDEALIGAVMREAMS
jgi:phage head maturation protease